MAERVSVDDLGIRVMHTNGTVQVPWAEVTRVVVYASALPPDGQRVVWMDATHVSGEYVEVNDMTEGFAEALAAVNARSGRGPLDLSRLQPDDGHVEVYHAER